MELPRSVMGLFNQVDMKRLKELGRNVDRLKAERDAADFDLSMHRETCEQCRKKTLEEIVACFGCTTGAVYGRIVQQKNRLLRTGGILG